MGQTDFSGAKVFLRIHLRCPHLRDHVPTLNFVFENQPIVSGILTQPSRRKQFASRRKGGQVVICITIHLYYRFVVFTLLMNYTL